MTTVVNVVTTPTTYTCYETNAGINSDFVANDGGRWRNGPQTSSMTSAAFLFIAGGMELALGLGWNIFTNIPTTEHFQFCWFVGMIAGALIAAPLISFLHKRFYYIISSLLVLASGIIFVSVPDKYDAIIAARYVNGVAIGFALVAFLVHGGEIGVPSYRGAVLSLEQYGFTFGMAIQVIYASQWTASLDFAPNRVHGIFLIVFAIFAFASVYLVIESPIFYLRNGNDEGALECLRLLQRPQIVTSTTQAMLADLRAYVVQEQNQSIAENCRKMFTPLLKVVLFRSIVAFTFSIPLNAGLIVASAVAMGYIPNWPPIVWIVLRVLGTFMAIWLFDSLGRKLIPLFSLLCIAGFTIGFGIMFSESSNVFDSYKMSVTCTLMLIAQFFSGLFAPSSSVYLGEAFPLIFKPYAIAFCVCIEQVIHIIMIVVFVFSVYHEYVYFITIGCIMFALFIYFCLALPETKNTTLREAQSRFRSLLFARLY